MKESLMRALALILAFTCFGALACYAQDSISSSVVVHFTVPNGWQRLNDTTFVLKDYDNTFEQWSRCLAKGHMPWRLSPANIAVTSLWAFGIKDTVHTRVWDFAAFLKQVEKDSVFSLTVGSARYTILVRSHVYHDHFKDGQGRERTEDYTIPMAYRFEITHVSENGG
jgi:hypothetical protein